MSHEPINPLEFPILERSQMHPLEPLWVKLNQWHSQCSLQFASHHQRLTFAWRRAQWGNQPYLWEAAAWAPALAERVGLMGASIQAGGAGEEESLYVKPAWRHLFVADRLMRMALEWLQSYRAAPLRVVVACGNERATDFYSLYGFKPRQLVLQWISPEA